MTYEPRDIAWQNCQRAGRKDTTDRADGGKVDNSR